MTATKEQLQALLKRVQAATGPDRELDADMDEALRIGLPHLPAWAWQNFPQWKNISGGRVCCLHRDGSHGLNWSSLEFTASIDAALALVERVAPGGLLDLTLGYEPGAADRAWPAVTLRFYPDGVRVDGKQYHAVIEGAPTPPLAILAALLRALISQSEERGE